MRRTRSLGSLYTKMDANLNDEQSALCGSVMLVIRGRFILVMLLVLFFSAVTPAVLADEPNVGLLRVESFQVPSEVAPNSVFNATIMVIYQTHLRPANATLRAAIYRGGLNFSDPIWQSSPVVVPMTGEQLWNVSLISPSTMGYFNLTAAAYFLDDGSWRFFNNSVNGPSFKQASIKVGRTARLEVDLGINGLAVVIGNQTITTASTGNAQTMLFIGETYVVSVAPLEEFQNSTRIVFTGWKDGNNQTERSILLDGDVRLVGSYRTQFELRVNSPVSSYSEWHDSGSIAGVHTINSFPMNWPLGALGLQYNFVGWSGDANSSMPDLNVTMDMPKTLNANFSPNYAILIIPVILAFVSTVVISLLIYRRLKTSEKPNASEDSRHCGECGELAEEDWTHCMHCGSKLEHHKSA